MTIQYRSVKAAEWLKSTSDEIQDGGLHPNRTRLNRHNLAAGCSISLQFCMWVFYGSAEVVELLNLSADALRAS